MPDGLITANSRGDDRTTDVLTTQARQTSLVMLVETYCETEGGEYPDSIAVIREFADREKSRIWCYFDDTFLKDAWGRPFQYKKVGGKPFLVSAGKDGQFGTADDIGQPPSSPLARSIDGRTACARKSTSPK